MKNFKFTINGNQYEVEVLEIDGNLARIEVNGTLYDVEMQREVTKETTVAPVPQTKIVSREVKTDTNKPTGKTIEIKAPLPGVIIKVLVKPGDDIISGQVLCTLETMKMENAIRAEKDGKVNAVNISAGQSVLQDEILMVMVE
jgi:biotin carboxyl carrier protein